MVWFLFGVEWFLFWYGTVYFRRGIAVGANSWPTRNWKLGVPIRQFELTLPPVSCLACDDEVLVLGARGEVLVYSLLPLRQLTTLHLGQESGQEEEVKLAVAKDFILTVQTTTRKMQVNLG